MFFFKTVTLSQKLILIQPEFEGFIVGSFQQHPFNLKDQNK